MNAKRLATVLVVAAVAAQLAVPAWMAIEREWILRNGERVYLRTAPVDPRDLFRGDYVQLNYEVNRVVLPPAPGPAPTQGSRQRRHEVVYTRLQAAGEGLFEAAGTTTSRPASGPFLRGRTEDGWRFGFFAGSGEAFVKYGIEQLFVEQGAGKAIEDRRGTRGTLQVPMEVEVALSSSGTAVIRGYRWSRLGMQLEVLRRPTPRNAATPNAPPPEGPLSPKLRITLANASDAPVAIADFGDRCAFRLVPVDVAAAPQAVEAPACRATTPTPADAVTLAPGQRHAVEIDLAEPRWAVLKDGKPVEIGAVQAFARYRIEYRTPALQGVPALWRGNLTSQAFNASGVVD